MVALGGRTLLVVDLQREFVKDAKGKTVYGRCLDYIRVNRSKYSTVLAAVYENDGNRNMARYVGFGSMWEGEYLPLEFFPDAIRKHSGYSLTDYPFDSSSVVDIIGFDTDACVLSMCFDLFNMGVTFKILAGLCWSSGGKSMHSAGLAVMRRQFGNALDDETLFGT